MMMRCRLTKMTLTLAACIKEPPSCRDSPWREPSR
jgi:hypothetical protein